MTKEETIKILAMLGAFYGGGKTDPKAQVNAWHCILNKYDFKEAERAVLRFAENDVRDYATFPAVGKIVRAIKEEHQRNRAAVNEVIRSISYGRGYESMSNEAKALISEAGYNHWLGVDAEDFANRSNELASFLQREQLKLTGGGRD
jgi:hypothetical protein